MTAVCPPSPIPSPLSTTEPFPGGAGGSVNNPDYYDSSGTTMFPANNATSGTTITIEIGGTNYDNFASPSTGGSTLVYVDSSVSQSSAITFSGTSPAVVITATSPSCFVNDGSTYYADVDADIGGTAVAIDNDDPITFTGTNTIQFKVTSSQNQFPGSPTKVQLTINKVPKS